MAAQDLVSTVLANLRSLCYEEPDLMHFINRNRSSLEKNLSAISDGLQHMDENDVFNTSGALRDWLRKLTDAANMLDDVLDECSTEAIRDKYEGHKSCAFLPFLDRQKVQFRATVGSKIKNVREALEDISEQMSVIFSSKVNSAAATDRRTDVNHRYFTPWSQPTFDAADSTVYGREREKHHLVGNLLEAANNDVKLFVCCIVGMGGVGKTTLAQFVYNDWEVSNHFDLKIWTYLSPDFNLRRTITAIMESARGIRFSSESHEPLHILEEELRDILRGQRFLLVLDDAWSQNKEVWVRLRHLLSCGSTGSSVLVTTRMEEVAVLSSATVKVRLNTLSPSDWWAAFRRCAFGSDVIPETEDLVQIGLLIAKVCGGAPLAATTLGCLLGLKANKALWLDVLNKLRSGEYIYPLIVALKLSFLDLSPRVQRCFSFCTLFPQNYSIEKETLIHLWMANGLISSEETPFDVEDMGDKIIAELCWRSLLRDVEKDEVGNIRRFKMFDFFHGLAQYVEDGATYVADGPDFMDFGPRIRHLSITGRGVLTEESHPFKKDGCLRTIVYLGYGHSPDLLTSNALELMPLRALDLSMVEGLRELPYRVCSLKHLRYLNLSNSAIEELPESICNLWNLQILNLDRCHRLKLLPKCLGQLKSLQHLYLRDCRSLSSLPANLGGLTSLRTLSHVIVGEDEKLSFQLSQLGRLKHLRGELKISHLERVDNVKHAQEADLGAKRNLEQLILSWGRNDDGRRNDDDIDDVDEYDQQHQLEVFDVLKIPLKLKYLEVNEYKGVSFPNWMMKEIARFRNMQAMYLSSCKNCSQLPPLCRLPALKSLRLENLDNLTYLIETQEADADGEDKFSFPSLETLHISSLASLENIIFFRREVKQEISTNFVNFPCLSELIISACPKLSSFASSSLPSLQSLCLDNYEVLQSMCISDSYLISLEELDIYNSNSIEYFPDQIFQGLQSLQKLTISNYSNLKSFPQSLKFLSKLVALTIQLCENLVDISNVFHQLTSLRRLYIGNLPVVSLDTVNTPTGLIDLPQDVRFLPALQYLELYNCPNLVSLPDWLSDHVSLEVLRVYFCPKLRSMPHSIQQRLSESENLYVQGCPELQR